MNSALDPAPTMPRTGGRVRALDLLLLAAILAQTLMVRGTARVRAALASDDRGEVLAWVTIAAGTAFIAALLLVQFRNKGETIVQNICTNADPTTC